MRWKADDYTWKEGWAHRWLRQPDVLAIPRQEKTISELEFARRSDRRANSENLNTRACRFLWLAELHEVSETKRTPRAPSNSPSPSIATTRNSGKRSSRIGAARRRKPQMRTGGQFIDSWKREFSEDAN
jgi:hypothetical protein